MTHVWTLQQNSHPPGLRNRSDKSRDSSSQPPLRVCCERGERVRACRGDAASDRTSGAAAVEDIGSFVNAGVDTLDCADHYGDAEAIIGVPRASVRSHNREYLGICPQQA